MAFLTWWAGGPAPVDILPGMRFSKKYKSEYVLAVLNEADPGHGLDSSQKGEWAKHAATIQHASINLLAKLLKKAGGS